jgi:hypothetical protein
MNLINYVISFQNGFELSVMGVLMFDEIPQKRKNYNFIL